MTYFTPFGRGFGPNRDMTEVPLFRRWRDQEDFFDVPDAGGTVRRQFQPTSTALSSADMGSSLLDVSTAVNAPASAFLACGCQSCMKSYYYSAIDGGRDGVGDAPKGAAVTPIILIPDSIAGDASTASSLTIDGAHVVSTINSLGDTDWFAINVVAGQNYEITMLARNQGPSGVPLIDSYVNLYDANGNLVTNADGGADTINNAINSGFDVALVFEATYTGVMYVSAESFNQPETPTPDGVGDYEIFVKTVDENQATYIPFYSVDSPLHSIDWGTEVDGTSRNPDGDNGTRTDNGVPNGGTPVTNNEYGVVGKNVITYYFARPGDVFVAEDPTNPGVTATIIAQGMQEWEKAAFEACFALYEQVADIIYIEVNNREEADFKIITYEGTPGVGASLLGRMSPPDTNNEGQTEINTGDVRWTEEGVSPGGFYFSTLLHEIGHGHGLAHPHDNGGRSSVMRGAGTGTTDVVGGGYGDFDLSQRVFTVMSYNNGWETSPYGTPRSGGITGTEVDHFGWVGSLSPFDIAVIQDKYGVNEEWATGDNVYTLIDENGPGAMYTAIWDGGGTDEIRYQGARDANIDLRAATLQYEYGGGGWVSYAYGVHHGFTIANGVTIENATSGSGNDTLIGNGAANTLKSGGGNDVLKGGAGDDVLEGGTGADQLDGEDGFDTASFRAAAGALSINLATGVHGGEAAGDTFVSVEAFRLGDFADTFQGSSGNDKAEGFGGADKLSGGGGNDTLDGGDGDDELDGGAGADALVGGAGSDVASYRNAAAAVSINLSTGVNGGEAAGDTFASVERFWLSNFDDGFTGGTAADTVLGRGGNDSLSTGGGNDYLDGGDGNDTLNGGEGDDQFVGGAGADAFIGGGGSDVADYRGSSSGLTIHLHAGTASGAAAGDTFSSIERFWLTNFVDVFTGSTGADSAYGYAGNDELYGGSGADYLDGGDGDDLLEGGRGGDRLIGGNGRDIVSYRQATAAVSLNLVTGVHGGEAQDDIISGVEGYWLSNFGDSYLGNATADFVLGRGGDDVIDARGGNDYLSGGDGNDSLTGNDGDDELDGGAGADALIGGAGSDVATYRAAASGVGVNLSTGVNSGEAAGDTYTSVERFWLSEHADSFVGTANAETVFGYGGADTIDAGGGNDFIDGGAGNDQITGGAGVDQFVFRAGSGNDRILDFQDGVEKISLLGIAGIDDFSDLVVVADGNGHAVVSWGGGLHSITLVGLGVEQVSAADFIFGP